MSDRYHLGFRSEFGDVNTSPALTDSVDHSTAHRCRQRISVSSWIRCASSPINGGFIVVHAKGRAVVLKELKGLRQEG